MKAESIFEYVIVLHPTKKEQDEGEHARILAGPACVLAPDEAVARNRAVMELAVQESAYADSVDRLEVAVRPFC